MTCERQGFLSYNADDDGVHLICERTWHSDESLLAPPCGFDRNLGFHATVMDVINAETAHHPVVIP